MLRLYNFLITKLYINRQVTTFFIIKSSNHFLNIKIIILIINFTSIVTNFS